MMITGYLTSEELNNLITIRLKKMNIEEYDFTDGDITADINDDEVWLCATAYSALKKCDVIALAKHFKLTANDLIGE